MGGFSTDRNLRSGSKTPQEVVGKRHDGQQDNREGVGSGRIGLVWGTKTKLGRTNTRPGHPYIHNESHHLHCAPNSPVFRTVNTDKKARHRLRWQWMYLARVDDLQ